MRKTVILSTILLCLMSCSDEETFSSPVQLCINEVMVKNSTILSPTGESSDWVELYNYGSESLELSDFFITDEKDSPFKKSLPVHLLAPGEFFTLWGEKLGESGNDPYLGFKISEDETLYVFTRSEELVDSVTLTSSLNVKKNESFGRLPDAGTRWGVQHFPSPKRENEG